MKRREFITLLAGAAAWPCTVSAQILRERPLVGILIEGRPTISPLTALPTVSGFLQGMVEVGYVDGRDFDLDFRVANGDYARLPMLAEELAWAQVRRPDDRNSGWHTCDQESDKRGSNSSPVAYRSNWVWLHRKLGSTRRPGHRSVGHTGHATRQATATGS